VKLKFSVTKSNNQLLALVSFVFRDKILKHIYSVTLARTDILPEDGHTVTETCRRFCEIL